MKKIEKYTLRWSKYLKQFAVKEGEFYNIYTDDVSIHGGKFNIGKDDFFPFLRKLYEALKIKVKIGTALFIKINENDKINFYTSFIVDSNFSLIYLAIIDEINKLFGYSANLIEKKAPLYFNKSTKKYKIFWTYKGKNIVVTKSQAENIIDNIKKADKKK
jgi:hypothetical protein